MKFGRLSSKEIHLKLKIEFLRKIESWGTRKLDFELIKFIQNILFSKGNLFKLISYADSEAVL